MLNSELGIKFYLLLSIILSRYLFIIGKSSETLRIPKKFIDTLNLYMHTNKTIEQVVA